VTVALGGTAALTLGAHGMHAPLAVGVGAAAARHALVLDDLAIKVVLGLDNAAKEHPAVVAGAGTLQASVPSTKRSPEYARWWRIRTPDLFTLCETRSSGATRREQSLLLSAPVRIAVVISVVGDLLPTTPARVDRPDLTVGSGDVVDIGYLLT
jgi:hypothetical protein